MKLVVTGAAGFIGSHLTDRLLAAGHDVLGIDAFVDYYPRAVKEDNLRQARDHRSFRLVEGLLQEIDLAELIDGAGVIYHLAAQAGVRASWGREFELYTTHNVLGTQRLLESAKAAGTPRVVCASSSSVYGESPSLPLREDAPCRPLSPYGVTKLASENLGILYHRNHGLPVVSLRYFTVYGPRQRPDMAFHRFLRACRDGETIHLYGDGEQTRDFTFIDDILAATLAAADSGRPGCVYNVGGGERVSMNEVIERIEELTGGSLQVSREESQKGDMRDTFADTSSAARELGFRPKVPLAEGLRREWEWIRGMGC